jgi:uncharacterized membrane protein YeaQ/YmgE (transglycosylase-associated protein family)
VGILLWILFGAVAGVVVTHLMPGPSGGGTGTGVLVGIAGALLGGFIGTFSAGEMSTAFDMRSLLMAVCGSLVLLFGYRCLATREAF